MQEELLQAQMQAQKNREIRFGIITTLVSADNSDVEKSLTDAQKIWSWVEGSKELEEVSA